MGEAPKEKKACGGANISNNSKQACLLLGLYILAVRRQYSGMPA